MSGHLDLPFHQGAGLFVPIQWGVGTDAEDIVEYDLTGAIIELIVNDTVYLMDALEIRLTAEQTSYMNTSNYVLVVTFPDAEPEHVLEGKLVGAHNIPASQTTYGGRYYA